MLDPLPHGAPDAARRAQHAEVAARIASLLDGEDDVVAAMSTVVCELHHAFSAWHWTGFYRVIAPELLAVGPYQGGHGCTRIPFSRGVCGAAARTRQTQRLADVSTFVDHIACSSSTVSELVVPVLDENGVCIGVFDVDSDHADAFSAVDQAAVEALMAHLGRRYGRLVS